MTRTRASAKAAGVFRHGRVIVCGMDESPGPRDACPNTLHDWPCPSGYVAHSEVAHARLYRRWFNVKCPDCGLYGWRPGRINPETDVRIEAP